MKFTEEKLEKAFTELLGQEEITIALRVIRRLIEKNMQHGGSNFATPLRSYFHSIEFQNVQFFC
jgi:hypothetical protein